MMCGSVKLDFKDVVIVPKKSTLKTRKSISLTRKITFDGVLHLIMPNMWSHTRQVLTESYASRTRISSKSGGIMGIDKQSDVSANIQIGPTDQGMVRIYIEADDGTELPMDFDPEEALDIAEELRAAAEAVRAMGQGAGPRKKK